MAQAGADKIRLIGEAEAFSIEAVGKAEAERMKLKAEAYQLYGEAAKTALVLEALPLVCVNYLYIHTPLVLKAMPSPSSVICVFLKCFSSINNNNQRHSAPPDMVQVFT